MTKLRRIKGSQKSEPGTLGGLLSCDMGAAGVPRGFEARGGEPELVRPEGLALRTEGGAALLRLVVGDREAGVVQERTFSLTRSGLWMCCAGWQTAELEILGVGSSTVVVGYAWTILEPQQDNSGRMLFVQSINAGGPVNVPQGAIAVTPSTTDAGWSWRTDDNGTPKTLATGVTAGARAPVLGDEYTAGVGNVLVWELWTP